MHPTERPGLKFIIIGLTSAIALKKSGHTVLVLEKAPQLWGADSIPNGGARLPPNGCKVLFDWGLESEIRENAVVGEGFMLYKYDPKDKESGREYIGLNRWDRELLVEARGDFLQMRHGDLLQILYNAAMNEDATINQKGGTPGTVTVLFDVEVTDIDCDTGSVTLRSGETHSAEVIIGADGASGVARKTLMKENVNNGTDDTLSGLAVYSTIIPKAVAVEDEELVKLYDYPQSNMATILTGPNRGAKVFLAGKDRDVLLWVYTPDSSQDGSWSEEAERDIREVVGPCDLLMQKLVAHAGPSTCVQFKEHCDLDSWVSASGKVVVIGEAAHPFPPISLHSCSVAIEDGACIGKLFSHTQNPKRVKEFLHAFQEHRKPRCAHIRQSEQNHVDFITLPDGEQQIARDATMRANHAAGLNVLDTPESDMQSIWDDMRLVFGYDPADAADEWWVSWGRLRDLAASTENAENPAQEEPDAS
ncbi:hypothetical protein DFH06DRAFT_1328190 [Mycena polygramma]|nr:hypothetical protein DFH06DRAFT_1328190 [Mycena polygramma]